jgi:hypothetical protein
VPELVLIILYIATNFLFIKTLKIVIFNDETLARKLCIQFKKTSNYFKINQLDLSDAKLPYWRTNIGFRLSLNKHLFTHIKTMFKQVTVPRLLI